MAAHDFVSSSAVLAALNRDLNVERFNRLVKKCRQSNDRVKQRERQLLFDGSVRSLLRRYVDEWLRTGRNGDGTETPFQRNLARTDAAKRAANEYIESHPFRVQTVFENDLHISIEPAPEPSKSVAPGAELTEIGVQSKWRAEFLFVATLASAWKHRLYRCPRCEQYELVKNPRPRYKHGMFCRRHHQAWSAERLTQKKRQNAKEAQRE